MYTRRTAASSSLVAAWGEDCHAWFEQLRLESPAYALDVDNLDIHPPSTPRRLWHDPKARVLLACAAGEHAERADAGVALASECVVALEGQVVAADDVHPANFVVDAYHRWGLGCAEHLEGDFGFVLWDQARRRFVVASSSGGKCALAYFFDGRSLAVASRALNLLRHPRAHRRWNSLYFAHVFGQFWNMPAGTTAFGQILRTRPNRTLVFENETLREHRSADSPQPPRTDAPAKFWHLLSDATKARFSGSARTCVTLSGGLDSSLVGASLAERAPDCHAFSLVARLRTDDEDERVIQAFLARFPSVQWHSVQEDDDSVRLVTSIPPMDDPIIDAHPFRGARIQLARAMREHGFDSVLDGEGGDELFGMSRRINDLVVGTHWRALARILATHRRRRALAWRGLVVPRLPRWARPLWNWREHRRGHRGVPWLARDFWRQPFALEAEEQRDAWRRIDTSSDVIARILENPINVGTRRAHRLIGNVVGVEFRSPLLDKQLIELAANLPADLQWETALSKPFLRRMARTRLPAIIVDREKDISAHRRARDAVLTRERMDPTLSSLLKGCEPIADHVDPSVVAAHLARIGGDAAVPESVAEGLYSLIATARWMKEIGARYGVSA